MTPHRLYVGTVGQGVFRSLDHGRSFKRACDGVFVECDVRALAVHPLRPETLYLGSEVGLYVSRDGADSWQPLPAPLEGLEVWSVCLSAARPDRIVVGTRPSALLLSEDAGRTWRQAEASIERDCPRILHTRVTALLADPDDPDRLWAGVEIDGVHQSTDGGHTWRPVGAGLTSRDVHALAAVPTGPGRSRLLATTNNDLNLSDDGGRTWRPANVRAVLPWAYCRGLAQRPGNPEVVFLGGGDGPPGSEGLPAVSRDGGQTWEAVRLPGRANSTIWNFAVHPAEADLVYAASVSGQVYRSEDGGGRWDKLPREFGEIRGLAWAPG
jgi:photosystem II stability/assembly factor-like uncharacterized protein